MTDRSLSILSRASLNRGKKGNDVKYVADVLSLVSLILFISLLAKFSKVAFVLLLLSSPSNCDRKLGMMGTTDESNILSRKTATETMKTMMPRDSRKRDILSRSFAVRGNGRGDVVEFVG